MTGDRRLAAPAIAIAGVTFFVALFFFSPRYVFWRALNVPLADNTPETSRAGAVLKQVADPSIEINTRTNRIVRWRLLIPWVAHVLYLPDGVVLAIPHLGCVATLAYAAMLLLRAGFTRIDAALATFVFAAATWFFVSTGWLSYADSWIIFGLLLIAFSPSRLAIATACVLLPWVDERIVLAAPLAGAVRLAMQPMSVPADRRRLLLDLAAAAVPLAAYGAFRAWLLVSQDATSKAYIDDQSKVPLATWYVMLEGVWMGVRAGWIFIAAFLVLALSRKRPWISGLLLVTLVLTLAVGLIIASDIGRSCSAVAPAAIAGLLLLHRQHPARLRQVLIAAVLITLFTPATHVVSNFQYPIRYVYAELDQFRNPPNKVNPEYYIQEGTKYFNAGQSEEALARFEAAIGLDSTNHRAYVHRSLLWVKHGDLAEALASANMAVQNEGKDPDPRLVRGSVLLRLGRRQEAATDLGQALVLAPPDWQHLAECRGLLARATGHPPASP